MIKKNLLLGEFGVVILVIFVAKRVALARADRCIKGSRDSNLYQNCNVTNLLDSKNGHFIFTEVIQLKIKIDKFFIFSIEPKLRPV